MSDQLNCKPNELARIVDAEETRELNLVDKIIQTDRLIFNYSPALGPVPVWTYKGPPMTYKCTCGCGNTYKIGGVADKFLRPIRDPGDDAVDEMLKIAPPVPTAEKVEA